MKHNISLEDICTYSTVVGELCRCIKDRDKSYGYKMEGSHDSSKITFTYHKLEEEEIMKWKCL